MLHDTFIYFWFIFFNMHWENLVCIYIDTYAWDDKISWEYLKTSTADEIHWVKRSVDFWKTFNKVLSYFYMPKVFTSFFLLQMYLSYSFKEWKQLGCEMFRIKIYKKNIKQIIYFVGYQVCKTICWKCH